MTRRRTGLRAAAAVLCLTALVAMPTAGLGERADAALPSVPGNPDTVDTRDRPTVQVDTQLNNRTVDSAVGIGKDGNAYVWGRTGFGMNGVPTTDDPIGVAYRGSEWPVKVAGLPEGGIVAVASGIYNFNALDTAGNVWGWGGWYPSRDGTGTPRPGKATDAQSAPAARLRVGSAWNGSGPLLSGITAISATEYAGAGIAADGAVYHWGVRGYGGNYGTTDALSDAGASRMQGLPDPTIPGNFPVYLKGGYMTFWVILENGDVYYWGGTNTYERPRAADGGNGDYSSSVVSVARKSTVLEPWTRSTNPGSHIVAVDSGINLGGALLSDGRVLTWGTSASRVGGRLPNSTSADTDRRARTPGVLPNMSDVVGIAYTFTGAAMVTSDGTLYGYGDDSYECFPRWPDTTIFCAGGVEYATVPGLIDTNVTSMSVGQGYVRWTRWVDDPSAPDGYRLEAWGQGWNPRGAIGHDEGTVRTKRRIEFKANGSKGAVCTEQRCDLAWLLR